jgi:hypothetical protein
MSGLSAPLPFASHNQVSCVEFRWSGHSQSLKENLYFSEQSASTLSLQVWQLHTCNPSTREAKARVFWVRDQPELHSKICLNKTKKIFQYFSSLTEDGSRAQTRQLRALKI